MGVVGELKPSISGKRSFRPSSSIRHATEWPISDVTSDLIVEVGTSSFSLHKFPLVSRSGRIRKLVLEAKDSSRIALGSVPGGAEAFELVAKFCYGVPVEITLANVAALLCAAHFLEMTDDFAEKNLHSRAEAFLRDSVLPNISNSIAVLHRCETLLPAAEETGLAGKLVNAVAATACKEQLQSGLLRLDPNFPAPPVPDPADWWGKSLAGLSLESFRRVVSAVKTKGLRQDIISRILVHYARSSAHGLAGGGGGAPAVVEVMVGLLPSQSRKSAVPMAFLSSLLKAAVAGAASGGCRAELERRMGLQLEQAILEDLLIPAAGCPGAGIYDTDAVVRIFSVFLNLEEDEDEDEDECLVRGLDGEMMMSFDSPAGSPKQSSMFKVSKLLDNYLAEVALDPNLSPAKFIALAELLPDHARLVSDGLYRAVDIFLKVHMSIKESERYRLCKTIDCQKLSQEGCSHAAQNERLPVQMAVQVLYFEQIRLRNAMNGVGAHHQNPFFFTGSGAGSGAISPRDNYASVRRENRELKLEVARMRMRLTDLEKDHLSIKHGLLRSRPATANRLFRSFATKLTALFRRRAHSNNNNNNNNNKPASDSRFAFHKRRRHSVS